jgi:hypothetical protein
MDKRYKKHTHKSAERRASHGKKKREKKTERRLNFPSFHSPCHYQLIVETKQQNRKRETENVGRLADRCDRNAIKVTDTTTSTKCFFSVIQ